MVGVGAVGTVRGTEKIGLTDAHLIDGDAVVGRKVAAGDGLDARAGVVYRVEVAKKLRRVVGDRPK